MVRRELSSCRAPSDAERIAATVSRLIDGGETLGSTLGSSWLSSLGFGMEHHREVMHELLAKELQEHKVRMAQQQVVTRTVAEPCRLARSAAQSYRLAYLRGGHRRVSLTAGSGKNEYQEVFRKLQDDNEVSRSQMEQALLLIGIPKPDPNWVNEIYASITVYAMMGQEEFVRFCEEYKKRHRAGYVEAFASADADGNGFLDHEELASLLRGCGIEPMRHVLEEVLAEVDMDGQGLVDLHEFEKVMELIQGREGFTKKECQTIMKVFDTFDHDESGEVDARELTGVLDWLGFHVNQKEVAQIVAEVDVDASGAVSRRELLVCIRKVREREVERLKKAMVDHGSGPAWKHLPREKVTAVLRSLGYDPGEEVVEEIAEEMGATAGPVDLSTLWRLLMAYRAREGMSRAELAEVEETWNRYDDEKRGAVSHLEVGRMLRWLGFKLPIEMQQELIDQVDVDGSGEVDFAEFKKLVRMHYNRRMETVREAFWARVGNKDPPVLSIEDAVELLRALGLVDDTDMGPRFLRSDVLPDKAEQASASTAIVPVSHRRLLWQEGAARHRLGPGPQDRRGALKESNFSVPLSGIVAAAHRFWDEARRRLRQNYGFTLDEVREFQVIFKTYDKDKSGDIGHGELVPLIKHALPDLAHDKAMRPRLLELLAEAGSDGSAKMDFDHFLQLMGRVLEMQERAKVAKEQRVIRECAFSQEEVKEFRQLFLEHCSAGDFELGIDQVIMMVCRARPFRTTQIAAFTELFRGVTRRYIAEGEAVRDRCDFPEFLCIMKKVLESNFAAQPRSRAEAGF